MSELQLYFWEDHGGRQMASIAYSPDQSFVAPVGWTKSATSGWWEGPADALFDWVPFPKKLISPCCGYDPNCQERVIRWYWTPKDISKITPVCETHVGVIANAASAGSRFYDSRPSLSQIKRAVDQLNDEHQERWGTRPFTWVGCWVEDELLPENVGDKKVESGKINFREFL